MLLLKDDTSGSYENLQWLVDLVRSRGVGTPKIILFTPSVKLTSRTYRWFLAELDNHAFMDGERKLEKRMVDMFHSHGDEDSKLRVQQAFTKPGSHIRVVMATIALGMGIDIPDLRVVIHWGVERSPLAYWQEIGRAWRDGLPAVPITYTKAVSGSGSHDLVDVFANGCIRQSILTHFIGESSAPRSTCGCKCCSHCAEKCDCGGSVSIADVVASY